MPPLFDGHMLLQILAAAVIAGLIGLDRTAVGQFMISQPVVAGPLAGWLLGDTVAGMIIGGMMELIWVLDLPIGTFVPADSTVATVSATAIAAISSAGSAELPVIGFSLLLTLVMVPVTMFADHLLRQRNREIPELVLRRGGRPTAASVTGWHLAGLIAFFLKSFTLCLGFVPAGVLLVAWFVRAPEPLMRAMALFVMLLPLLGVASMARKLSMTALDRSMLTGFAIASLCVLFLKLPLAAAVLLAAIGGWAEVRFREA